MAEFDDLPNEILIKIFSYLEIIERQRLVTVCQRWNSLIESMWLSEDKLIIYCISSKVSLRTRDWPIISCENFLIMKKVLGKFDSHLKKLMIYLYGVKDRCFGSREIRDFCHELSTNKQLDTFMMIVYGTEQLEFDLVMMILESIPTESLQHLDLSFTSCSMGREFEGTVKTLLGKTALTFLHLHNSPSSMVEIINKINSLESLSLGKATEYRSKSSVLLNIMKLPNLKELKIYDPNIIDDIFLRELGNNGKSLLILELSCGRGKGLTQSGYDAIGNLVNLKSLSLMPGRPIEIEFLCKLSNLEQLNLPDRRDSGEYERRLELLNVLECLPKLKRCHFGDERLHDSIKSNMNNNSLQVKNYSRDYVFTPWKRLSGFTL